MKTQVYENSYKDKKSIVLESSSLRATYVSTGSRMVSLIDKASGREFLCQGKSGKYISGRYDSCLPDFDPSGFDEMFPSINECFYEDYPWKGIMIPDHGEVWSLEWYYDIDPGSSLNMSVHGVRFPYRLEKRISFRQENVLRIDYRACNLSQFDMNFLWAAHPMMKVEENTEVILPAESSEGICVYDDGGRLGDFGSVFNIVEKVSGSTSADAYDSVRPAVIHRVRDKSFKCTEKYYIKDKLKKGTCGIKYPSDGSVIMINFPVESIPYLGVLVADGGIDNTGCVVILEPCSAPYDRVDFARAFMGSSILRAKDVYEWYLEFEIIT